MMKACLVILALAVSPPLGAAPPNIVLIVADDLGYGDLGCYGSEVRHTPHIDALASAGLRFTDFHSGGAMCSPTRASLLTGCYPQRFGAQFDSALSGEKDRHLGLPLAAVTIAELLKVEGYATACFGKWHLGYQAPLLPMNQGFDVFRGLVSGDGDFHTHVDRSGNEDWWHNDTLTMESGYTTDLLTRHGIDFIRAHRDRPFFLYLPHLAIHFPWQGPQDPPHRRKGTSYQQEKWGVIPDPSNVAPHVKAMVEALDRCVGELMAALRAEGVADNTLVIFTSDNGGYLSYSPNFRNISSNGPFRGQKMDLYEGGHRVPMIVSWPGRIAAGVTEATTHSNDLLPTLAKLAHVKTLPPKCDGADLTPLILRGEAVVERKLFWRTGKQKAVRSGPWKWCLTGRKTELFNLDQDPGEENNVALQHPEIVQTLGAAWDAWNEEVNHTAARHVP